MAVPSITGGLTEWALPTQDPDIEMYWCADNSINKITLAPGSNTELGATSTPATTVGVSSTDFTAVDMTTARRFFYSEVNVDKIVNSIDTTGPVLVALMSDTGANQKSASWPVHGGKGAGTIDFGRLQGTSVRVPRVTNATSDDVGFDGTQVIAHGLGVDLNNKLWACAVFKVGYLDPYIILDGTAIAPADFSIITDEVAADESLVIESPSNNIHLCKTPWLVGDGSTETHFSETLKTWEFVGDFVTTGNTYVQSHVNDNDMGFEHNASALDTGIYTTCVWLSDSKFFWGMLGSASATRTLTGCVVKNAGTTTVVDGVSLVSHTFDECDRILSASPTMTNCIIKNSSDTVSMKVDNTDNISTLALDGTGTGMLFDFVGSSTVGFDAITFSGYTTDVEYTGTGTLTINLTNGAAVGTTNASGGGTIVVNGDLIEQGLSFTGLETDSQVVIYESGTLTEIASVASSIAAFEWKELYSADRDVDYTIIKEGFIPIRVADFSLSSTVVPVPTQQVEDRPYSTSSGLTFGTTAVVNAVAKTIAISADSSVQNTYNALNEFWRAETSLKNINFPCVHNGPNSFTLVSDWEFTSGSYSFLSADGVRYLNTAGARTAVWSAIQSVDNVTGLTAEYQQVIGSAPTNAASSGQIDELIQVFGDATHGNFDYTGYLEVKYQPNGYEESSISVSDQYGTLEDQLYVVSLQPTQYTGFTLGDPAVTGLSLTNHGASPVLWNGKNFSITITDTNSNTAEDIHRWLNYNKSLDSTFQGEEPFNLFDMVVNAAGSYETQTGTIINSAGALSKGVRVIDGVGDPQSFFNRFQSDDGTYYTPPQSIILQAANLTAGRIQLYNVTTSTEIDNAAVTTGYNTSWIDGTDFTAGDTVRLRWANSDKELIEMQGVAPSSGSLVFIDTPISDTVYVSYGIDGSTVTEFTADYPNIQIDINDPDDLWYVDRMYSWYKYNLTQADGIRSFWNALTAIDAANIRINSSVISLFLDNIKVNTAMQADVRRLFREDGLLPVINPTTGGGGLTFFGTGYVFTNETGVSGLTSAESIKLNATSTYDPTVDIVEGTETYQETQRLIRAMAAGKLAKSGSIITFRDEADTKDRITATTDTAGQRTAVTTDVS